MKKNITKKDLKKANWEALTNFKYTEGIKVYKQYTKTNQLTPTQLCELGLFYDHRAQRRKNKSLMQNDEKKAKKIYKQALERDPKLRHAWLGIARIYWHKKDKRCIKYFKKVIRFYPKKIKWQAYQNLANAYFSLEKYKEAKKWYLKALKNGAEGHGFFYNLTQLYYFMGNKKKVEKYSAVCLKLLNQYWKNKKKPKEYILTKQLLKKIKNGTL